ncbi:cytoplasmic protein [Candidatus Poribacteria bacterium]|nr:cytoplasmic protein [Candidatus Poribacteria bacterium]
MTSDELRALITERLGEFHTRRLQRLHDLKLRDVLAKKNPYLFRAVGDATAAEIIESLLIAFLSASDEGIFGDVFFEPIARIVSGGTVSPSEGVDIAIETENRYLAIAVKSGPNPFNSSQAKRQNDEFRALQRRLTKLRKQFDPMLGHCYGKRRSEPTAKLIYRSRAGQAFWEELTGDPDFYQKLLREMGDDAIQRHREEYRQAWCRAANRYVRDFTIEFCDEDGDIDWAQLLEFNSGSQPTRGKLERVAGGRSRETKP